MRVNSGSGIDPSLVEQLVELEKIPLQKIERKKEKVTDDQKIFAEVVSAVSALGQSLTGFRTRTDFVKLKSESSNADIIDGVVDFQAVPGTYEVEVKSLAKTHKLLADGYPDKDATPVGFGYMTIEYDGDKSVDVEIDPINNTLQDVAEQINSSKAGVKAVIMNTKENIERPDEDTYRLLVLSEKSGKAAQISIDPDSSYLEFKDQVVGQNLHLLFEDVEVFDEDNTAEMVLPGLVLNAKRAAPGTKVTIKIDYDVDKTLEAVQGFVDSYNKASDLITKQFTLDPKTQKMGPLATDNTLRTLSRQLKNSLQYQDNSLAVRNLGDLGITSDSKTGNLKIDAAKAKKVLSENYLDAVKLFTEGESTAGFGASFSNTVRSLQNTQSGVLPSKDRQYKRMITEFDEDLVRKERTAGIKTEGIKRRFASLEQVMSGLNSQSQAMQARLGGG